MGTLSRSIMAHPEVLSSLSAALVFALCCATAAARAPEFESLGIEPAAFFPLVDGDLRSYPDAKDGGEIIWGRMLWDKDVLPPVNDDVFPGALSCVRRPDKVFHDGIFQRFPGTVVELDNVPYGTQGDFSVNLWMRYRLNQTRSEDNELFGYIFSHAGEEVKEGSIDWFWQPSQIHLYLPSEGRPLYGLIRGLVKDADDEYLSNTLSKSWLDSDGLPWLTDIFHGNRVVPDDMSVMDGKWHMVTVTSLGEGRQGYRMYVDGVLAGEMPQTDNLSSALEPKMNAANALNNTEVVPGGEFSDFSEPNFMDGGDPLNITGKIHLCGRPDRLDKHFFDGDLAHLSLWDKVLSETQVAEMFEAVVGRERLEERCVAARNSRLPRLLMMLGMEEIDPCPFVENIPFSRPELQRTNSTQFWEGVANTYEELLPIAKAKLEEAAPEAAENCCGSSPPGQGPGRSQSPRV